MVLLIIHAVSEHDAVSCIDTETIMQLGVMTIMATFRRTGIYPLFSALKYAPDQYRMPLCLNPATG